MPLARKITKLYKKYTVFRVCTIYAHRMLYYILSLWNTYKNKGKCQFIPMFMLARFNYIWNSVRIIAKVRSKSSAQSFKMRFVVLPRFSNYVTNFTAHNWLMCWQIWHKCRYFRKMSLIIHIFVALTQYMYKFTSTRDRRKIYIINMYIGIFEMKRTI